MKLKEENLERECETTVVEGVYHGLINYKDTKTKYKMTSSKKIDLERYFAAGGCLLEFIDWRYSR